MANALIEWKLIENEYLKTILDNNNTFENINTNIYKMRIYTFFF